MGMARLLWITGRRIDSDLASSTEVGLLNGLKSIGHSVEIHYPGEPIISPDVRSGLHPSLRDSKIPGFKSYFCSISAIRIIRRELSSKKPSVLLIDWRLVPWLARELSKYPSPWFLIDRGPPAYSGILGKLQWHYWKKSWKIASISASGGMVVSESHEAIVRPYSGDKIPICSLSGGVRKELISSEPRLYSRETLQLVYVGRLDRNRGILDFFKIIEWADNYGLKLQINVAGDGDESHTFYDDERINHHGVLTRDGVADLLSKCDVGLLPMPAGKVWKTASPLKLAEYAAAGLAVIGVDHEGHRMPESSQWIDLGPVDRWWVSGLKRFHKLTPEQWGTVHSYATKAANNISFDKIAKKMIDFIESID